jgi:hypothetical protein
LLRDHYAESVSAVLREPYALPRIRHLKPVESLMALYDRRDGTVCRLGGSSWAEICRTIGPESCVFALIRDLSDDDPGWRAFAAEALGELETEESIPHLLDLLGDREVVRLACEDPRTVVSIVGEAPVALIAAEALAEMGRPDGVDLLLEYAARIRALFGDRPSALPRMPLPYADAFRRLSGEDFGDDLESWQRWFDGPK